MQVSEKMTQILMTVAIQASVLTDLNPEGNRDDKLIFPVAMEELKQVVDLFRAQLEEEKDARAKGDMWG